MRADPGELAFRKMLIASPGSHAPFPFIPILHPPISLSYLSPPSPPPRAINLRLRQWRRCITRPLRACVWVHVASSASSVFKRPLSRDTNRLELSSYGFPQKSEHTHRSYYSIILSLSKVKRDTITRGQESGGSREFSRLNHI